MTANILALMEKIGPNAIVLINFLVDNKYGMAALIALLMTLFNVPPARQAVSDDEFIAACKKAGASTGDAQELLAAIPR